MNILSIGYGSVQKAVMIMWEKIIPHRKINKIIIIDPRDFNNDEAPKYDYDQIKVALTKNNYQTTLDDLHRKYKFDFVIDLSVNTDSVKIIEWVCQNNLFYINTAIEEWQDDMPWDGNCNPEKLKHHCLQDKQNIVKNFKCNKTILVDHGMNPGMCSHFAKRALRHIAKANNINKANFRDVAHTMKLDTIHISEIDTQVSLTNILKSRNIDLENTFITTWSPIGYIEESFFLPVEIGYNTELEGEDTFQNAVKYGNQRIICEKSVMISCRSVVPKHDQSKMPNPGQFYEYVNNDKSNPDSSILYFGNLVAHSENNTLPNYLQKDSYNPSTYYVYRSCPESIESLNKSIKNNYKMLSNYHVLRSDEVASGYDSVGALLLFNDKSAYWCGTIIDNEYAKKISPVINSTTIQVACGVLSGIEWVLTNPNMGVIFPESVDDKFVFKLCKNYLGMMYSGYLKFDRPSNKLVELL